MAGLANIQSRTWGIGLPGPGSIVEGLASLRQCIDIILRTSLGTDPLRPFFGSDIYKYQDAPLTIAIPNIKKSIIEALRLWETRIEVSAVKHYIRDLGHIEFEIIYGIVDSDLRDSILFDLYNGTLSGTGTSNLILQALFPPGIDVRRNNISLVLNNAPALPLPPVNGFANVNETYAWVVANWGNYGRWYLLNDRIQVYLRSGNYQQASLTLSVSSTYRHAADIPELTGNLNAGDFNNDFNNDFTTGQTGASIGFHVIFKPESAGNTTLENTVNDILLTKEQLLIWVRANWGQYGNWQIENAGNIPGAFSVDFSTDFAIDTAGYQLVLYSNTNEHVLLNITTY